MVYNIYMGARRIIYEIFGRGDPAGRPFLNQAPTRATSGSPLQNDIRGDGR